MIKMGKKWVSKKDPRWICERTISYGTMNYATLKTPNPEYVGLTLEQAKAREKIKELEIKKWEPGSDYSKISAKIEKLERIGYPNGDRAIIENRIQKINMIDNLFTLVENLLIWAMIIIVLFFIIFVVF